MLSNRAVSRLDINQMRNIYATFVVFVQQKSPEADALGLNDGWW
jgi:hypothetical protein